MPDRDLIAKRQYLLDRLNEMNEQELVAFAVDQFDRIAELELENIRLSGVEQLHTEAGQRVGYITAYRATDGDWSIEWDGEPIATPEDARADLLDAAEHCLPGLECRTLTVYDEEIQTPTMMLRFDPGPRRRRGAR